MTTDSGQGSFWVRLLVPAGDPDGIKVIEKSNWIGCGLVVPRSLFATAKGTRRELDRTGVYLLVGPGDIGPLPRVYIGEGDPVLPRLENHGRQKDFWTHAVIFTSKDENLNKAHVQHLESRLVDLAGASKRCALDNGNIPQAPSLSEADKTEAEGYLADMLLCMPLLGYDFFVSAPSSVPRAEILHLKSKGIEARGAESASGFIVLAGSQAVKDDKATSMHSYLEELRKELIKQGVLVDRGPTYVLSQHYTFSSPSSASGVLLGVTSNGRTMWKTEDGRSLKSLQDGEDGA